MQCTENCFSAKLPDRVVVVIMGGSGDLANKKIIPAFIQLTQNKTAPPELHIFAVGRSPLDNEAFRQRFKAPEQFLKNLHYVAIPSYDRPGCAMLLQTVATTLASPVTEENFLFHLAVPPQLFVPIVKGLKECGWLGMVKAPGWVRVVVEKPYGRDERSSRELNRILLDSFQEQQIYRIDHYLGKEAVQNLLVFRFANLIFEPVWNNQYIDHVQISVFETAGVGHRSAYYDSYGVTRDMLQNHLLQLVTLVAMEPPETLTADHIRTAKVNLLRQIKPLCLDNNACLIQVRGQYGRNDKVKPALNGYREEPGIPADSSTETYAAMKLFIDNQRWNGVPFYLRSGKRLSSQATMIVVQFKKVPHILFNTIPGVELSPNRIIFKLQPDEGIILETMNKVPGYTVNIEKTGLDFYYREEFKERILDAYERLLLDALLGDPTLFVRSDETELAWKFIDPLIERWQDQKPYDFPNYPAGSNGPREADRLLRQDGREWVDFKILEKYRDK